ncbi:GNAT family N-acetyltransferase [bacterium]|nr:GNAT family N-acetyltransferase [bacterium]
MTDETPGPRFWPGERVYLRGVEEDDIERGHMWINDPATTRFLLAGRRPINLVAERQWVEERGDLIDHEISFAICLTANDRHIGTCGLNGIEGIDRFAVFGIMIGEADCRGQGYGTEATRLCVGYAFDVLNLHRVELTVSTKNPAAVACYRRAGFKDEGLRRQTRWRRGAWEDEILMSVLVEEWRVASGE